MSTPSSSDRAARAERALRNFLKATAAGANLHAHLDTLVASLREDTGRGNVLLWTIGERLEALGLRRSDDVLSDVLEMLTDATPLPDTGQREPPRDNGRDRGEGDRVYHYDGACKCYECGSVWGAIQKPTGEEYGPRPDCPSCGRYAPATAPRSPDVVEGGDGAPDWLNPESLDLAAFRLSDLADELRAVAAEHAARQPVTDAEQVGEPQVETGGDERAQGAVVASLERAANEAQAAGGLVHATPTEILYLLDAARRPSTVVDGERERLERQAELGNRLYREACTALNEASVPRIDEAGGFASIPWRIRWLASRSPVQSDESLRSITEALDLSDLLHRYVYGPIGDSISDARIAEIVEELTQLCKGRT